MPTLQENVTNAYPPRWHSHCAEVSRASPVRAPSLNRGLATQAGWSRSSTGREFDLNYSPSLIIIEVKWILGKHFWGHIDDM